MSAMSYFLPFGLLLGEMAKNDSTAVVSRTFQHRKIPSML
jgi:hypothetical protein